MPSSFSMTPAQYNELDRQMLASPWMQAIMLRKAEAGKAFAKSIAPVDTGNWADSFEADAYVRHVPGLDGVHGRAVGRLSSTDPNALSIEFGTATTPAHRTLGQSLGAMRAG